MSRTVVTSDIAKEKLEDLFEYLIKKWSYKVKSEFVQKLDRNIEIIKEQPEIFPESTKEKGLRRCVITKQTTLFYSFNEEKINIVTIFDTRKDPEKLKRDL
ncbi:plasmid stabilization system protein ParE [Gillisia sp. Hel_I_86]|uniref:type II toxin-antitoxin system RelE/ParE family toxin n=1 Tax=Gillisia sp. Hel_I_86 TaxID=1249981 RepID=UPI001198CF0A|nr:type II toxin-antitoxin system RelE/ParE family toxin [Gillisia sp. Hel_I_86]TVZ26555.1 plasmid stabilization system protein ParE [Gillisia sp. Hel_I_86]TVZ26564.1 plasmid stabilization system protein ParE [Gillisia sp. Hel_I_86]TVZ27887.1 plasmid stabilization system protein ParE [Gillisia sp. Hel_I_86]TVZ28112.1 plasmid stabilization system protein ParE [Gillisia sp. Hel_I_86]